MLVNQRWVVFAFWAVVLQSAPCLAERPTGWGGMTEGYEFEKDSNVKHGGSASGTIRSTADAPTQPAICVQRILADNYRNKRVRLSGYLKTEGGESRNSLWMRVDSHNRSGLAFDNMAGRKIRGTSDWVRCEIVLDVPQDATSITLGALLAGKGQMWVDDVKLESVTNEVQTTDMKPEPRPYDPPTLDKVPKRLSEN